MTTKSHNRPVVAEIAPDGSAHLSDREVREKMVVHGPQALSDSELLGLLIGPGSNGSTATQAAEQLFRECGGTLTALAEADLKRLRVASGLGIKRAVVVAAALELSRRIGHKESNIPQTIRSNQDVVDIFRSQIAGLRHEEFWVLFLSSANTLLDRTKVGQGGVSGVTVDNKLIVKRAVELLCTSIILVHNHPSGVALPSDEDKSLTSKIAESAALFDIAVIDHLVITAGDCFSFRAAGLL